MKKTIISIFEIVTLLALLFAPLSLLFVDNNLLFPYITSKNFAWRLVIEIALVSWASLALLDARYRINLKNPLVLSFAGFVAVMGLANLFGFDPYASFWSNAERMDGYVGLLHMFAFFIALLGFSKAQKEETQMYNLITAGLFTVTIGSIYSSVISRTMSATGTADGSSIGFFMLAVFLMVLVHMGAWEKPNMMKTFLHNLLGIGVLLGVMAFLQDKTRADAVLGNPIYLASYASFCVFVSAYYMTLQEKLFAKKYLRECLYGGAILFFVLIIFETATRGAVLGLFFGGLVTSILLAITARDSQDRKWRILGFVTAVVFTCSILGFFVFKDTIAESENLKKYSLIARAANFDLEDKTTKHRISNWEMALEGISERPVLGWGQESYVHIFSKYYRADELYDAEQWFDRTHNMFLDWLLFGGLLGLGSFLLLLGMGIYIVWRRTGEVLGNVQKSVLTGIIVAYMAQNFVAFDALATGLCITVVLGFIAYKHVDVPVKQTLFIKDSIAFVVIATMFIILLFWLPISYYQPRALIGDFIDLLRPAPTGMSITEATEQRLDVLSGQLQKNNFVTQEVIEQLLNRPELFIREGVNPEVQQNFIATLIVETDQLLKERPHLTRVHLFFASFLTKLGMHEKAELHLKTALSQSPEKINIIWQLSQNAQVQGRTDEVLPYLKTAAELAPDYKRAQQVYNQMLQLK